jgi:hypothetical protein
VTVFDDPNTLDLLPAAVVKPAPLRFAGFTTAVFITHFFFGLVNIQEHEVHEEKEGRSIGKTRSITGIPSLLRALRVLRGVL